MQPNPLRPPKIAVRIGGAPSLYSNTVCSIFVNDNHYNLAIKTKRPVVA